MPKAYAGAVIFALGLAIALGFVVQDLSKELARTQAKLVTLKESVKISTDRFENTRFAVQREIREGIAVANRHSEEMYLRDNEDLRKRVSAVVQEQLVAKFETISELDELVYNTRIARLDARKAANQAQRELAKIQNGMPTHKRVLVDFVFKPGDRASDENRLIIFREVASKGVLRFSGRDTLAPHELAAHSFVAAWWSPGRNIESLGKLSNVDVYLNDRGVVEISNTIVGDQRAFSTTIEVHVLCVGKSPAVAE